MLALLVIGASICFSVGLQLLARRRFGVAHIVVNGLERAAIGVREDLVEPPFGGTLLPPCFAGGTASGFAPGHKRTLALRSPTSALRHLADMLSVETDVC
jgi:hypothetical protein